MKGLAVLVGIVIVVGCSLWWGIMRETMSDQGLYQLIGIGNPGEKTIDMVACVEIGMPLRERPQVDKDGNTLWDEWVDSHFEMRDSSGKKLPFTRVAHSLLVNEDKVKVVSEFYVKWVLQKGEKYTLEKIPSLAKQTRYRYDFTAPAEERDPQRVQMMPVQKG